MEILALSLIILAFWFEIFTFWFKILAFVRPGWNKLEAGRWQERIWWYTPIKFEVVYQKHIVKVADGKDTKTRAWHFYRYTPIRVAGKGPVMLLGRLFWTVKTMARSEKPKPVILLTLTCSRQQNQACRGSFSGKKGSKCMRFAPKLAFRNSRNSRSSRNSLRNSHLEVQLWLRAPFQTRKGPGWR